MHRLAVIPGDLSDQLPALVEQTAAPFLFLSSADSDLSLLAKQKPSVPIRALNIQALEHPAAVDHYLRSTVSKARLVLVRLLGGRGHWSYGIEQLREWARGDASRGLLIVSGTVEGEQELASLGNFPDFIAIAIGRCLREGGAENMAQVMGCCSNWLAGEPLQPPEAIPQPDPYCFKWQPNPGPKVGLIFYRSLWSSADLDVLESCASAMRDVGLCPRLVLVSSLRDELVQQGVRQLLQAEGVELILCATGFASVKADEAEAGAPLWQALGVPVLQLLCSTLPKQRWQNSSVGLGPLDLSMQVALPELDGRITGRIVCFKELYRADAALECAVQRYCPDGERMAWMAALAKAWVHLRRTPEKHKKIAIVLANYPCRNGRLANGVGLDTPASAVAILQWLKGEGYYLGEGNLPEDSNALIKALTAGRSPDPESFHLAPCAELAFSDYENWYNKLDQRARELIAERWGIPANDNYLSKENISICGLIYGNVVILLQPSRGYDRDPSLNYHCPDLPPNHNYLAHYLWLREKFNVDAVIHLGKHGNLEWLPGKGIGLSANCFPELAFGALPNIYPFIVNDPGEGSQAKRRSQAVILDHLTPPLGRAGLHNELVELEGLVDEYWEASSMASNRVDILKTKLSAKLSEYNFDNFAEINAGSITKDGPINADFNEKINKIDGYLCELKEAQIRTGLHTFGLSPSAAAEAELLLAIARFPGPGRLGLGRAIAKDLGIHLDPLTAREADPLSPTDLRLLQQIRPDVPLRSQGDGITVIQDFAAACLEGKIAAPGNCTTKELSQIIAELTPRLKGCAHAERSNLLAALRGERIEAGPSGAPTRGRPEVLPTGRNFYSVDLRSVPTEAAWDLGRRSAEALLEQHLQIEGEHLTQLAISIWGTSTMRSGGDDVAQVFAFMGIRPQWDGSSRRMVGLELIPTSSLARPRVDVTVRISGFFRDAFPQLLHWLDQANQIVRQHTEGGVGCEVYGSAPGAYGAGLQGLIESGNWEDRDDLAEAFLNWSKWHYRANAEPQADRLGLEKRLQKVQVVLHNQDNREHDLLDSDDYYQFHGGMAAAVRRIKGSDPKLWFGDHSQPLNPKPKPLALELDKVIRSRLLNPRWIEGMQRHGYKGAFEFAASLDYLFAYDACTDLVPDWAYSSVCERWLEDSNVQESIRNSNPWALRDMAERLLEANNRGLWQNPKPNQLEFLKQLVLSSDENIEINQGP